MTNLFEPTAQEIRRWARWGRARPEPVQTIAKRLNPWTLYRMASTTQRVFLMAINENGTITVGVTGQFNKIAFDRTVFGVDPDDLTPCDPPSPDEEVGTLLSPVEVGENIDALRVAVRPDLWVMNADGKAERKQ